jgi:two-component system NarL family sensor kinase
MAAMAGSRTAARLAWSALGVSVAALALASSLAGWNRADGVRADLATDPGEHVFAAAFLAFPVVGALIARRHPRNPIGWLFCAAGVASYGSILAREYAARALVVDPGSLPAGAAAAWLGSWLWVGGIPLLATFPLLLFPDGRLPSRRWRPAAWLTGATLVVLALSYALEPGPLEEFPRRDNPVGVDAADLLGLANLLLPVAVALALASLVVRLRRASGEERQQLLWLAGGAALVAAAMLAVTVAGVITERFYGAPLYLAMAALGVAIGVAMLRYRLYDLGLVVNRTLVYGALTAVVVAMYVAAVVALDALFRARTGAGIAAAGLVAVLALPIRTRLQRRVNRLMYGDRDDPYVALERLGRRVEAALAPEAVLPAVVDAVAQALRLPFVAVELPDGEVAARHGDARGPRIAFPLSHRDAPVGTLVVTARSPSGELSVADRRLLEGLARQAGVAVHAVELTTELRRSRQRLVTAREEERRRLRRDLHDGLGPTLAAMRLQLEAAGRLARADPLGTERMLGRLAGEARDAIAEIRRLAQGLRPPALDELGLVGALREQAARLARGGLATSVEAGELPPLPAAVEVAAFRIASEAMTNASRHAGASRCEVALAMNGELVVAVRDDGRGMPEAPVPGVGMTSMRERAAELGGTCVVERAADGGTAIRARLPVAGP